MAIAARTGAVVSFTLPIIGVAITRVAITGVAAIDLTTALIEPG